MDNRRKIGVGVCSVALGFEVVSLVALIFQIWEFLPVQLIIIGLCIAMIVVQVMGITARAHLIMSIIALIVAVIQVIAFAVQLAIDIDNNAELNTEDAGVNQAFYYYICVPICLLFVGCCLLAVLDAYNTLHITPLSTTGAHHQDSLSSQNNNPPLQ